jgi:hypothetical protein
MEYIKFHYQKLILALYIAVTGVINIIGFFALPSKIATHIDLNGVKSNYVSSPLYLVLSFLLVILLSFISNKKVGDQKVKYFICTAIIVVVNIVVIINQI